MKNISIMYDWPGISRERDKALEKLAKRFGGASTGSGYSFMTGQRDIGFSFKKSADCKKFVTALKAKHKWAEVTEE